MSNEPNAGARPPIELTQHAPFRLGAFDVRPATLEVVRGEERTVLEPRVMQVLTALFLAQPDVVSRDDLIAQCWSGRIVGEDAINRVIGRLRRLSEIDGGASFAIETIPRVGYRLRVGQQGTAPAPRTVASEPAPLRPSRRYLILAGAGVATVAAAGGGYWYLRRTSPVSVPPAAAILIDRGIQALRQGTAESQAQAVGALERAVQLAPQSADAWGELAMAYAFGAHNAPATAMAMALRAQSAIRRATDIDPHNAYAYEAQAWLLPRRGTWGEKERFCREGLRYHPEYDGLWLALAEDLAQVGRNREAAACSDRAIAAAAQLDPALVWLRIQITWAANRLTDADDMATQGIALFPRQSSVWFSRLYLLMFTGRLDEALGMLADQNSRPTGIPDWNFDQVAQVATALKTRAKADVDAAVASTIDLAHKGAGFAENALMFLSVLGRVDDAFAIANGMYFGRGFTVGTTRFSSVQGTYTVLQDRRSRPLFLPPTRPMRQDKRFAALVNELGLSRYWRENGRPDFETSDR